MASKSRNLRNLFSVTHLQSTCFLPLVKCRIQLLTGKELLNHSLLKTIKRILTYKAFFIDKINPNATIRNGYWNRRYRRGFCVLWKRTISHSNYQLPIRLFVRWRPTCQGHAPKDKCDLRKNRYQDWQQYSGDTRINRPNNSLKCHHHCTKYKFEVKTPTLENFQE